MPWPKCSDETHNDFVVYSESASNQRAPLGQPIGIESKRIHAVRVNQDLSGLEAARDKLFFQWLGYNDDSVCRFENCCLYSICPSGMLQRHTPVFGNPDFGTVVLEDQRDTPLRCQISSRVIEEARALVDQ